MEKHIEEKDVFEKIKTVIYELCPVKQPRVEWDIDDNYKDTLLEIKFYFYSGENNSVKTQICFMKDNISEFYYSVDGEISNDTIGKIILFLLTDFPYVNSLSTHPLGFEMSFGIDLMHFEQKGISCNKVNIDFETRPMLLGNFSELFRNYYNYIISNFTESVSRTPQFKEAYEQYRANLQKNIINSFSEEDLYQFINFFTEEEIRDLLLSMNTEQFFKLCDRTPKDDSNKTNVRVHGLKKKFPSPDLIENENLTK